LNLEVFLEFGTNTLSLVKIVLLKFDTLCFLEIIELDVIGEHKILVSLFELLLSSEL